MPQIFQVLRCYKCLVFQVHQTKKSIKWECKVCGEKQSIKRHYGIGTAKDCRLHVQKLNVMKGDVEEMKCDQRVHESNDECNSDDIECNEVALTNSKWSQFIEVSEPVEDADCKPMCLGDVEVVLEIPKKRKKNFSAPHKSNKNTVLDKTHNIVQSPPINENVIQPFSDIYKSSNCSTNEHIKVVHADASSENTIEKKSYKTNVVPPVVKINSKWAGYADEEDCLSENTLANENNKLNVLQKSYVSPVININSKWAGYVEDEGTSSENIVVKENYKPNVVQKKYVPPTINKNSKWAGYIGDEEIFSETTTAKENYKPNVLQKKCGPSAINNNAKWAGYVKDEGLNITSSPCGKVLKLNQMFSLCDDSELDNILNI